MKNFVKNLLKLCREQCEVMLESENCGVIVENVNDKDCQQKFTRRCVAYADVTNGSQTGPACSGIK